MLNLERLRVLHAVSTAGSVVGAARTLQVTTSAVSQQVARLEREVGQQLVERRGRGIVLTSAGERLAADAADLLGRVERVEAGLARYRGAVAGTLQIAAFATAARGLLPGALRKLRTRHPDLSAALVEQEPHEAIPALHRGAVDVAVVQDWDDDLLPVANGLSRQDLLDDVFDLALPVGHPLACRDRVAITELAGDAWITWSSGQICHDWLIRTLRAEGEQPRIAHTASEHTTQIALVAAELGNAVIPRLGREAIPQSVRIVAIDSQPTRHVFALWRDSAAARPAIRATVDALQQEADQCRQVAAHQQHALSLSHRVAGQRILNRDGRKAEMPTDRKTGQVMESP